MKIDLKSHIISALAIFKNFFSQYTIYKKLLIQDIAQLSISDQQVIESHLQLLNSEGLYKEFISYSFPNLISEGNIEKIIETLSSKDPDQTITVKSAYVNAQKESSNGLVIKAFKTIHPVIDLKNCIYYSYGKILSQQLANFFDGYKFCSSLATAGGDKQNIFFC